MTILYAVASSPVLVAALQLLLYMTWVFLISLYLRNNAIVDVGYGLGFILVVASTVYDYGRAPLGALLLSLVSIWGLRLAIRIHERNRGKPEDFRYAAWRAKWVWFKTRSFFQIYLLQGAIIFCIALPALLAGSQAGGRVTPLSLVGVAVWILGFLFESIGDYQLDSFIKSTHAQGALMERGLWAYSRHPNYFGEATMWWGIWLVALPSLLDYGIWITLLTLLVSPILITYFLLEVSGVPMLEAAMQKRPGWSAYAARVSVFIPWFPRKR